MLLPLHLVWKLNAPQLWEPPDGVINTNAGAVYHWHARDRWEVLGLSLHWSVMWAIHRCDDSGIPWPLPSTPPRAILAVVVVVVIVCVWIHSRVSKRGHFPPDSCLIWSVEPPMCCQGHLPSQGWFPQEWHASSPSKPSRPGLAFCAN